MIPQRSDNKKSIFKTLVASVRDSGGILGILRKSFGAIRAGGFRLLLQKLGRKFNGRGNGRSHSQDEYAEWLDLGSKTENEVRVGLLSQIQTGPQKPLISVLLPVFEPDFDLLNRAIGSIQNQTYTHWQLCIADDASKRPELTDFISQLCKTDVRVRFVTRSENGHISLATNSALELATGDYVALLDQDDLLHQDALLHIAHTLRNHPDTMMIYSDEDKLSSELGRHHPYFKSDWNPGLFLSHNMVCHLAVYNTDLVRQLGGFRTGFEGAQDYDLALRVSENIERQQIVHIPKVLYHWRAHAGSTAAAADAKPYALEAGRQAISEHLQRTGSDANVETLPFGMYRVRYRVPEPQPLVTLIIPTRNGLALLRQCIRSIVDKTRYENYEILVIDNGSDDPDTIAYLETQELKQSLRVLRDDRPFNFALLNNAAVEQAAGEFVLLLNNDIEVISPEWLGEMVSIGTQPGVGVVGARLWYANDTLQHGGIILGIGGVAGHSHKHLPRGDHGYFSRPNLIQDLSAMTGACMLVRKSIYADLGGMDEENLKIAFNDVDFCLRVREAGYRNVWTPYAELYHHESASRGYEDSARKIRRFDKEADYMKQRWGDLLLNDPAYNPNLTLEHEDFSLAWPPRI